MRNLFLGVLFVLILGGTAWAVTPYDSPLSISRSSFRSSRDNSNHNTPSGTPRSMRRRIPPLAPVQTRRFPSSPRFQRRALSAPVTGISLRQIPLPPTIEAIAMNPRTEERWTNLMYQFSLENDGIMHMIRSIAEEAGSVKLDVVCGMTSRHLNFILGESTNYDMSHRVKMIRNMMAELFDFDPRRFKPGRVEIVEVETTEEEGCSVRVSPYRLRTIDEAFDDLMISH